MSASEFERIPECVFRLFDEIMNRERPVYEPAPFDRAAAYIMAWGWKPPLLNPGSETDLTQYGLAAYSWNRARHESGEAGIPERRFRYEKDPAEELLTAPKILGLFGLSADRISKAYHAGRLTRRIKVGHGYAYLHDEIEAERKRKMKEEAS